MRDTDCIKIAKALADPTRFAILEAIRAGGSMNCSQVCESFPLSQPTISHHIKTLEAAGLITVRKEGHFHVLTACEQRVAQFVRRLTPGDADSAAGPTQRSPAKATPKPTAKSAAGSTARPTKPASTRTARATRTARGGGPTAERAD